MEGLPENVWQSAEIVRRWLIAKLLTSLHRAIIDNATIPTNSTRPIQPLDF
jgi:hypothetical protein